MPQTIRAWAAQGAKQKFTPFEYNPGPLKVDEIEVFVEYCGLCHSDYSVWQNEWMNAKYPLVPGHEVIGRVVGMGSNATNKGLKVGQRVGVGWTAESCMHCHSCLSGDQHLCPDSVATIVGHYGGFADHVRAHWAWAIPIPDGVDPSSAGPMLCGGITVFSPLLIHDIKPTQKVGVVGIGGLGHMALKFANAWGCEVTAFTSNESKRDEAMSFGAHHVISSKNPADMKKIARSLDLVISTVNVPLDWQAIMGTLAPKGNLHVVGAVLAPLQIGAFDLIGGQRGIAGSPTGAPVPIADMLEFAGRHKIAPQVEHFNMSRVNEAMERLESGKARYRIVLDADFA